jgi:tyrosyl-DNA phosphodiesterase-1
MASNNNIIDLTDDEPPRKKAKVAITTNCSHGISRSTSLDAPISPPKRRSTEVVKTQETVSIKNYVERKDDEGKFKTSEILPSPFQLTRIRDLSPALNQGTVTLKSILCDPMISECWEFNYLHDLDFLMNAFDPDTRDSVKIHVVHGFWKQEDAAGLKVFSSPYYPATLRQWIIESR